MKRLLRRRGPGVIAGVYLLVDLLGICSIFGLIDFQIFTGGTSSWFWGCVLAFSIGSEVLSYLFIVLSFCGLLNLLIPYCFILIKRNYCVLNAVMAADLLMSIIVILWYGCLAGWRGGAEVYVFGLRGCAVNAVFAVGLFLLTRPKQWKFEIAEQEALRRRFDGE